MVCYFPSFNIKGGRVGTFASKTAALVLAALLLPSFVWAAGLGKLTVLSTLGQPLKAEIEILSLQPGEAEGISARLASQEAYRLANIELQGALYSLKFAVERRPTGQRVVAISSTDPINEPFVDILIELNWSAGKLVREYTFLLDPPEYKGPPVATPAPEVPADGQPVAQPLPVTAPEAPPVGAPSEAAVTPPTGAPKGGETYEVKRGDTLSRIAQKNMGQGVTLAQMLVALYQGNREAFDGDNMNRLRAGRILNLSTGESAQAVTPEDARRLVATQSSDFNEYRRRIGAAVATAPARADAGRQAGGRIGAPTEEKPAPPPEPAKDQLRLSKAGDAKSGGPAGAAARSDDLSAKDKALKEANERIAMLEKNLADMQKLAQLKSEVGAQLQQAAKAGAAAKAEATKAPEPATAAEPAKAAEAPKAADATTAAPADAAKAEAAKVAPDAAKAAAPKTPAPPPPPPPSFIDDLLDNEVALAGAGGVIVLLAGYAAYAWKRKRKLQVESSMMGAAAGDASSNFGSTGGRLVDTAATPSFQSDFSHEGMGKIDTEEIDPVAEADVYMAYGRDVQAEEILKEALTKDPARHAARVKLLEVYANRKDLRAFEATATELYAATNGQGADWEKAASLGVAIDPGNPLYGGKPAPAAAPKGAPDMAATMMLGAPAVAAAQPQVSAPVAAAAEAVAPAGAPPILDFDLDLGSAPAQAAPAGAAVTAPQEASGGLDFDLDLGSAPAQVGSAEAAAPAEAGGGLDFDLDLGFEEQPAKSQTAPAAAAPESDGGLDFDIGLPPATPAAEASAAGPGLNSISLDLGTPAGQPAGAPAVDAHWQEVATKLDLAKAYEEMGDRDGSRELLNEVIAEGDAAQKQQAKTMLEALG